MLRTNQNKTRNLIYKRTEIITLKLKGTANNVKPCMQLQFLWYFCTPSLCNRQTDKQTVTQTIYHLRTDSLSLSSSDDHIRCDKERIIFLQKTSNCNITNLTTNCVQLVTLRHRRHTYRRQNCTDCKSAISSLREFGYNTVTSWILIFQELTIATAVAHEGFNTGGARRD